MTPEQTTATPALPLHPQDEMECRRCGVHCDKVVYPAACLDRACPFVYSYEAWGHTYVGCMQKIYDVEIDLDMLRAAERRRPGFGAIRAVRRPLPMCHAEVERTYESRFSPCSSSSWCGRSGGAGWTRCSAGRELREDAERRLADGKLAELRIDAARVVGPGRVRLLDLGLAHRQRLAHGADRAEAG